MAEAHGYFQEPLPLDRRAYASKAKLELALQGLEYFFAAYGEGIFTPSTAKQVEAQRLHMAVLERDRWRRLKFVHRFESLKEPKAQEWVRRVQRENPGAVILNPYEDTRYQRIVDRVLSHPKAGAFIRDGRTELHGYARCPRTGMLLYSRPDVVTKQGWVGDLKFVDSVDDQAFNRAQYRNRWFLQLAFYNFVHGLITGEHVLENCFWIAVEHEYPHRVQVFTMEVDFEKMGLALMNHALDLVQECLAKDPEMKNFEVWRAHSYKARKLAPEPWMAMNNPLLMDAVSVGG